MALEEKTMYELYKIEGDSEFAYFNANIKSLREILKDDWRWVIWVMDSGQIQFSSGYVEKVRRNVLYKKCKIEKEGENFFDARGTLYFCYRIEAINEKLSRITPLGKLSLGRKLGIPIVLLIPFIIPIVFAPFVYWYWIYQTKSLSTQYLESFCRYLERRGNHIFGKGQQGEILQ